MTNLGVTIPWTQASNILDVDYLYRWSGNKPISPLVKQLCGNSEELPAENYAIVAGVIWANYGDKWTRIYDALSAEYNPLENYNMVENYEGGHTDDATTHITADPTKNEIVSTTDSDIYGYNSSSPAPADKSTTSTTQETDTTNKYDNESTDDHELTRRGNIGVTTSQQMLEAELNIRRYNFFENVYRDIDKILALPIYDADYNDDIYNGNIGGVKVTSVNGKTGDVVLYGSDIDVSSLIQQRISTALTNLDSTKQNSPHTITGTLYAGETSITLTSEYITNTAYIDIWAPVGPLDTTQFGNSVTLTFEAQASDITITLAIVDI